MKTSMGWRLCFALLAITLSNHHAFAAGVVTAATESNLRAALAGGGNVTFAVSGTIALTSTLVISNNTVLDASGSSIILSGAGSVGVLFVWPNVNCTLKHLTVADGYGVNLHGAGMYNLGQSRIVDCIFSNNATVNPSGIPGFGGAIGHHGGTLSISGSTFVHNRSDSSAAAISVNISYGSATQFAVTNSTFYGNRNGYSNGAALGFSSPLPASWIVNCTFAWNTNGGISVGSWQSGDNKQVVLLNTIVANSVGGVDCGAYTSLGGIPVPLRDGGHNIVSDASAVMTNATTLRNTNPLLGPLTNNGGPTWTAAPLTGSLAIDHADNNAAPNVDQRGFRRPYGLASDIGAHEWAPPLVIHGRVSGVTLIDEVSIAVDATTFNTTNGWFMTVGQTAGMHTVTPSHPAYLFVPANRAISVGPDQLNVDFKAYRWNALSLESATNGVLHLAFAGTNGASYRMLASSNLVDWFPISTNSTGTSNLFEFFDAAIQSNPTRFYKTVSP